MVDGTDPSGRAGGELFHILSELDPSGRRAAVLAWLAEHPGEPVALQSRGERRAALDGVDLGRNALAEILAADPTRTPTWWLQGGGVSLAGARLDGANLRQADLSGAALNGAVLSRARLGRACLQAADLEQADLRHADLTQADLRGAVLGGANAADSLMEDADLREIGARHADMSRSVLEGASLEGADLWGAILDGADLGRANLKDARLEEARLAGADLSGADLRGANLRRANLQKAKLTGADLQGATLTGANLNEADLSGASLQGVALVSCGLRHVRLAGAWLERTRFRLDQLGGMVGEELDRNYDRAREGYLALEQNFRSLGDPDAASWAYRRNRRMQKLGELARAKAAFKARSYRRAELHLVRFATDQAAEWLCDYGESMARIFGALALTNLGFVALYAMTDCLVREIDGPGGESVKAPAGLGDLLIYSTLAMTTSGPPDIQVEAGSDLAYVLSGTQGFIGLVLLGLLGFVLGNRIRR